MFEFNISNSFDLNLLPKSVHAICLCINISYTTGEVPLPFTKEDIVKTFSKLNKDISIYNKVEVDCRRVDFKKNNIPLLLNKLKRFDIVSLCIQPEDLKYIINYKNDLIRFDMTVADLLVTLKRGILLDAINKGFYLEVDMKEGLLRGNLDNTARFLKNLYHILEYTKCKGLVFSSRADKPIDLRDDGEIEKMVKVLYSKYRNNKEDFMKRVAYKRHVNENVVSGDCRDNDLKRDYIFKEIDKYF